ncbi:MAG: hypothetical protein KGJ01_01155 [Patescibacteria group bacterium]|nr:hypothetical protein [Patescibacteria group bacterium]
MINTFPQTAGKADNCVEISPAEDKITELRIRSFLFRRKLTSVNVKEAKRTLSEVSFAKAIETEVEGFIINL